MAQISICIVDYGMGNLRSAQKGLEKAGYPAHISDNPRDILDAHGVVLPGVGAFKDCYDGLDQRGLVEPLEKVAASGKPFLGICVGMQLLFEESEEGESTRGLCLLPGKVVRFPHTKESGLKVPHMGWNQVRTVPGRDCPLLKSNGHTPFMYFVHSYFPVPTDEQVVLATSEHGIPFAAVVGRDNVLGTQFHPEKSQRDGIELLRAFGRLVEGKA